MNNKKGAQSAFFYGLIIQIFYLQYLVRVLHKVLLFPSPLLESRLHLHQMATEQVNLLNRLGYLHLHVLHFLYLMAAIQDSPKYRRVVMLKFVIG